MFIGIYSFDKYILVVLILCLVTPLCSTLCDPLGCSPPGFSVHGVFQEYWSSCQYLLHRLFQTHGLKPCLLHCRQMLYLLSHQRDPCMKEVLKPEGSQSPTWHQSPRLTVIPALGSLMQSRWPTSLVQKVSHCQGVNAGNQGSADPKHTCSSTGLS